MQIASVKPNELALLRNDEMVLLGDRLAAGGLLPRGASMIDLITHYDSLKGSLGEAAAGPFVPLNPQLLKAPVERPSKIWGAATNYKRGSAGLEDARGRGTAEGLTPEEILQKCFLKPPSAIIGPGEETIIPRGAGTIFPELELCIVIGKKARNLSKAQAMDAVFGYTIILDMTARDYAGSDKGSPGSRCVRKGFETFAPIGPSITTKDAIPDPQNLMMRLWVNGELRQSAKTDAMVNGVVDLVSFLSSVTTLYPGDLIATGNPDSPVFQKKLSPGDTITAEIEGIGTMNIKVGKEV